MQISLAVRLPTNTVCAFDCSEEAISLVPYVRWDLNAPHGGKSHLRARFGSFLEGIDTFDGTYFGISLSEAELMDPQQRLLLEVLNHEFLPILFILGKHAHVYLSCMPLSMYTKWSCLSN